MRNDERQGSYEEVAKVESMHKSPAHQEMEYFAATRVRHQFTGRLIWSVVSILVATIVGTITTVDNAPHVGAIIDGLGVVLIPLVVVLAVIWSVVSW